MAKLRVRASLSAIAAGILITIGGCTEQAPTSNSGLDAVLDFRKLELAGAVGSTGIQASAVRADKVIGPEGGTLEIPGGHKLTFPAGALGTPTRISAAVDTRYVGVDLQPEGLRFPAGNGPLLTIDYGDVPTEQYSRLAVLYVAPSGTVLEVLQSDASRSGTTVSARLSHFSGYLVGGHRQ
ncbi:MAG: hypothetical protein ABW277_25770 [Longimicrobiaceae bacterium]